MNFDAAPFPEAELNVSEPTAVSSFLGERGSNGSGGDGEGF